MISILIRIGVVVQLFLVVLKYISYTKDDCTLIAAQSCGWWVYSQMWMKNLKTKICQCFHISCSPTVIIPTSYVTAEKLNTVDLFSASTCDPSECQTLSRGGQNTASFGTIPFKLSIVQLLLLLNRSSITETISWPRSSPRSREMDTQEDQ